MITLKSIVIPAFAAALLATPLAAAAQVLDPGSSAQRPRTTPSRTFAGVGLLVAQPVGEFGDYVDVGVGIGGHLIHQLDRTGAFALRADLGFLVYGSERKRIRPFPRLEADIKTSNNILIASIGPQLMVPSGRLRPYVNGSIGLGYFYTQSTIEGRDARNEGLLNTTNHNDATFAWSGGGGLYIPVRKGLRPVSIDLGARFQANGRAEYLREGSIQDNLDNTYSFTPIRSQTDLVIYQIGVAIGL
ncbi:MAG: hypothetical protein M3373_09185 [Gemmatimonadota bacterium]|nr:hypothetical protein [Gemmatimonadota bacterium]